MPIFPLLVHTDVRNGPYATLYVMRRLLSSVLLASVSLSNLAPISALAAEPPTLTRAPAVFNPHAILNDEDLFSLGDWDAERIQQFLVSKKSALARFTLPDIDGQLRRPADILWRVAGSYTVNPKYLLVLLQKEQSLVEHPNPSQKQLDWATGYAVCDACSMNDPRLQEFRGFANQLEYAAKQHRERYLVQLYTRGMTIGGHAPGKTVLISGVPVTPVNNATAMLYSYTPHLHGNRMLWTIWQRWFAQPFAEGTILRERETGTLYLLKQGQKRPLSVSVAASLVPDLARLPTASAVDLASYPEGKAVPFPNYSLVVLPTGTRYLLSGSTKRRIVSTSAFRRLGFQEDELLEASDEDLAEYTDGPDLTASSKYPTGILARDTRGDYWYVEDTVRQKILHPSLLTLYFRGRPARTLSATELHRLTVGAPYPLRDGELVRSTTHPAVYVMSNGNKRPIPSEELFFALGYAWNNVLMLPESLLEQYPTGEPLVPSWKPPADLLESLDVQAPPPEASLTSSPFSSL